VGPPPASRRGGRHRERRQVTGYEDITYEVRDGIAVITLDRPERMNTLTYRMVDELIDAIDRVDSDDAVRVAVVTGSGRMFCAGADLEGDTFEPPSEAGTDAFTLSKHADGGGRVTLRVYESVKPFIAAVNGAAAGFGATFVLPMDVRLAADSAKFGFVFVRRGIVPESCSSWFLPRLVGMSTAADWIYSGRVFGAEEALERGLVTSLHPREELLASALDLARTYIEGTAPVASALSRRMLWGMLAADHPARAHQVESRALFALAGSADEKEGIASFFEKRPPRFTLTVSRDLPPLDLV
jgi:enoyl-CoA hydratase/carnithine racemase